MLRAIASRLKTLNFFASTKTATNEYELRNEQISTRLFLLILIITILIIFIYTAQIRITQTIEVKEPSFNDFQSLSLRHSQTLRCLCDNVAIPHGSFLSLIPQFHQVCSSVFITEGWRDYIAQAAGIYISDDFSYMGSLIFLTLASFCNLANKTLTNALITFSSTAFISSQVLNEKIFVEQVSTIIDTFQSLTELSFYQSFDLIQYFTQSNSLLSGLLSNTIFSINPETFYLSSLPQFYDNHTCNCDATPQCADPLVLKDRRVGQSNSSSYFKIPGLLKGCYLVEAVRQSTLECFYQASCISIIRDFLDVPFNLTSSILPLNSSVPSKFNISSTIDELLGTVMTEMWQQTLSYAQYFKQCKVSSCSYSVASRFNILYMFTTLIAIVGGLIKVLRITIPHIVKFIRRRIVPPPIKVAETVPIKPSLLKRLWNFNYFSRPTPVVNHIEIKQQIQATRIFFLLVAISFIVLLSYYGTERINYLHQIESPTFEQFLRLQKDQQFNPSLSCPCSTLVITYKDFLRVDYELHPLCSSDFVQLKGLPQPATNQIVSYDFRYRAPALFNSLANLCEMSARYINDSLMSFNASLYIVNDALTPQTFTFEANAIVDQFLLSMRRLYARSLAVISKMTWSNGIMSGKRTNFNLYVDWVDSNDTALVIHFAPLSYYQPNTINERCLCSISMQCISQLSVYRIINYYSYKLFDLTGLYFGCLQTESMRFSTLFCFFNQSCVDLIGLSLNISGLQAISSSQLKLFQVNSTIGKIEDELFVNQWNIMASHRAFYEQCRPARCTYTLVEHNSIWIIVTVVFGLFGGLVKILQVLTPRLVQIVYALIDRCRRCQRRQQQREMVPVIARPKFSFRRIYQLLRQVNFFASDDPSTVTERELQDQLLSTRIFVFLLVLSLVILIIYTSQVQITKTVTINNPSINQYLSLYKNHSRTLSCPCKNITIFHQTFLTLQPTFHQVCQSDFIDDRWLNGLFYTLLYETVLDYDFRLMGTAIFGTISSLCQLSHVFITNELLDFNTSSLVSVQIIPKDELIQQGQSLINLFISTNKDAFVSALQIVRDTTYTNALISGFESTISIRLQPVSNTSSVFMVLPRKYNHSSSCTCSRDPTCIQPAGIYNVDSGALLFTIPGIFIGCYMVEATLQSNLAFLYDQNQIDLFRQITKFDNYTTIPFNSTALNVSHPSQYNVTTPINIIMENMMIESWQTYVNYSAFYEQCQPIQCKYTYTVKYDAIYIITTITSLIGGLVTIYRLIIPRAIKLIRWLWLKLHYHIMNYVTLLERHECH